MVTNVPGGLGIVPLEIQNQYYGQAARTFVKTLSSDTPVSLGWLAHSEQICAIQHASSEGEIDRAQENRLCAIRPESPYLPHHHFTRRA